MAGYLILKNDETGKHYSASGITLIHLPDTITPELIQGYGLPQGTEAQLDVPFTKRIYIELDSTSGGYVETDTVTTDPFTIYDEFGDIMEVLYYTDDESVTEANLAITANWSPLDELEGDFEIVTWTDEPADTAKRVLEISAIPKPQFVYLLNTGDLYGDLGKILVENTSVAYRDELRILFTPDQTDWYRFDGSAFKKVAIASVADAKTHGMKHADVAAMTSDQLSLWPFDTFGAGLYLEDNAQGTIVTSVKSVSYDDLISKHTCELSDTSLYVLNTTARIDLQLAGSTVFGVLSDDDLTRVQYRVILNDEPYFPLDGSFTELAPAPTNINLEFRSSDIKVDDWNTLKVEFKDYFGTVDYWAKSFVGTYNGLVFKDVEGGFYSDELGQVIKFLDFGLIYAGQTTLEHEIILRNQYGYAVNNVQIYVNQAQMPNGMTYELSKTSAPFMPTQDLVFEETLNDQQEVSFFIRLKTELATTPETNGKFTIVAKANKV